MYCVCNQRVNLKADSSVAAPSCFLVESWQVTEVEQKCWQPCMELLSEEAGDRAQQAKFVHALTHCCQG